MIIYERIAIGERTAICVCTRSDDDIDWGLDAVMVPYGGDRGDAWHPLERFESIAAAVTAAEIWFQDAHESDERLPEVVGIGSIL